MRRAFAGSLFLSVAALAACGSEKDPRLEPIEILTREKLLDPETCKECHAPYYDEWAGSMHAYASADPLFRAMNARGQRETKGELGNFCVNCHAPLAVQEGATVDGTNLDSVPKHLQGVTCYFCHQATEVIGTHNNPLKLANDTTMRGGIKDPLRFNGHQSAYSPLHDQHELTKSSAMCGACHDISVPGHFSGASANVELERTYKEWQSSIFADPTTPPDFTQSCGDCHMKGRAFGTPIAAPPNDTGTMPSRPIAHDHSFAAIDTALVDFQHDGRDAARREHQLKKIREFLLGTLRVALCLVDPLQPNLSAELENLSAGHYFPSGATQDRRLWIELHAFDKRGVEIGTGAGVVPPGVPATSVADENMKLFRSVAFKADGVTPAHMFWDVAKVDDSRLIRVPTSQPEGGDDNVFQLYYSSFPPGNQPPARATATVWLEPVGLDVMDDLIAHETGEIAAQLTELRGKMPRFAIADLPDPSDAGSADAGSPLPVTIELNVERLGSQCADTNPP